MTITFSRNYPKSKPKLKGEPTNFLPKVWQSFDPKFPHQDLEDKYFLLLGVPQWDILGTYAPKPHTIRGDKKKRWEEGKLIHFKIWTGKPYVSPTFEFAPPRLCTGVEKIKITWLSEIRFKIEIEGRKLSFEEMTVLARNDGFNDLGQFLDWFDEDFEGVIIHWTALRYSAKCECEYVTTQGGEKFKTRDCKNCIGKIDIVDPVRVEALGKLNVDAEEIKVLQATIKEIKATEAQLLTNVLTDYLGRKPEQSDTIKCAKAFRDIELGKHKYELWHEETVLGMVEGTTTKEGGVRFYFTPNKK